MPSKGVKTTEFWMMVATGVLMVINGTTYVEIPWDQFTIWMAAQERRNPMKALLIALLLTLGACTCIENDDGERNCVTLLVQ